MTELKFYCDNRPTAKGTAEGDAQTKGIELCLYLQCTGRHAVGTEQVSLAATHLICSEDLHLQLGRHLQPEG